CLPTAPPEHAHSTIACKLRKLVGQPTLANARLAGDEKEPASALERVADSRFQLGKLALPANEDASADAVPNGGDLSGHAAQCRARRNTSTSNPRRPGTSADPLPEPARNDSSAGLRPLQTTYASRRTRSRTSAEIATACRVAAHGVISG